MGEVVSSRKARKKQCRGYQVRGLDGERSLGKRSKA